ncbi:MAG: acyl carrier protein [Sphaerochaetaceae bacterium]|jgi:acyl carrier protein|nr:acyl carrier protein [Sphaerochaetaceae bacterium]
MTENQIFDTVKKTIVNQLGVDEAAVKAEASFVNDLRADSMDILEMVSNFEETFSLQEIPEADVRSFETVGDVVKYLVKIIG